MRSKSINKTALASLTLATVFCTSQLQAQDEFTGCENGPGAKVRGKIVNNGDNDALGFSTLGVVALRSREFGPMKCALVGMYAGGPYSEGALPNFTHTISCDDLATVPLPDGSVIEQHSQLSFNTSGFVTGGDGACMLDFVESSRPIAGSGRGAFIATPDGELSITGTINTCTGAIDMQFRGEICPF